MLKKNRQNGRGGHSLTIFIIFTFLYHYRLHFMFVSASHQNRPHVHCQWQLSATKRSCGWHLSKMIEEWVSTQRVKVWVASVAAQPGDRLHGQHQQGRHCEHLHLDLLEILLSSGNEITVVAFFPSRFLSHFLSCFWQQLCSWVLICGFPATLGLLVSWFNHLLTSDGLVVWSLVVCNGLQIWWSL